ncbi:MAG: hypothetical protein WED09_03270 [Homoserinimonas sp.]
MNSHPLAQDDYDTVQAYMATRVAALLGASAHSRDWEIEVAAEQDQSAGQWERRNGFLFDYTLGRFLQAVNEARALRHNHQDSCPPIVTDGEQFAHDFTAAIIRQDAPAAESRWQEFNGLPYWPDRAPIALPSTLALIRRLQSAAPSVRLADVTPRLPEPFDPPVVVS